MIRLLAALSLGVAIAVTVPLGNEAQAKKKNIACKAMQLDGKAATWKCKAGQVCCWNMLLGQGTCNAKGTCL